MIDTNMFSKERMFLWLLLSTQVVVTATLDFCPCKKDKECSSIDGIYPDDLPIWAFYFDKEIQNHGIEESLQLTLGSGGKYAKSPSRDSYVLHCVGHGPCVTAKMSNFKHTICIMDVCKSVVVTLWLKMNYRVDEMERMASSPVKKLGLVRFKKTGFFLSYDIEKEEFYVGFSGRYRGGNFTQPYPHTNQWMHIAMMALRSSDKDQNEIKLFINGVHVTSTNLLEEFFGYDIQHPYIFEKERDQTVDPIFYVDLFKVWNRYFSDEEIAALYENELPCYNRRNCLAKRQQNRK